MANRGYCEHRFEDESAVARIPWISRHDDWVDFEESKFYKDVMASCSQNEGQIRRKLYVLLNNIFPFYLPKRYLK